MYKLISNISVLVFIVVISTAAHATVVTHGNLTTDDANNFITDTVTGRIYTRFDAFDLSYADTLNSIGTGGAYYGWSIATDVVADEFIAALLAVSTTPCTGYNAGGVWCGSVTGWVDGDFGLSSTSFVDSFAFAGPSNGLGLVEIDKGTGVIDQYGIMWTDPAILNLYTTTNHQPINLLLYTNSVPAPATLALMGLGLAGLGFSRRRKGKRLLA